jgi:hypothetical protein
LGYMLLNRHDMARSRRYSVFFRVLHGSALGEASNDRMRSIVRRLPAIGL